MAISPRYVRWYRDRYLSPPRPDIEGPSDLMQLDTIHLPRKDGATLYVFTALDVRTRFPHAWASERATAWSALCFLERTRRTTPFRIKILQSDQGSEFSRTFSERARIEHRHLRVRRPNDNAHLERFNRTLQEECLDALPRGIGAINGMLPKYLRYYNEKRYHFGLNLKTSLQVVRSY